MKDYMTVSKRLNRLADRCHDRAMHENNPHEMMRWQRRFLRLNRYMREYICHVAA